MAEMAYSGNGEVVEDSPLRGIPESKMQPDFASGGVEDPYLGNSSDDDYVQNDMVLNNDTAGETVIDTVGLFVPDE